MNRETRERTESQKDKIIGLLREAGDNGVLNTQLSKVALRYNARIQELYVMGYKIDSEELAGGVTKYILKSEPSVKVSKPEKAIDVLINDIKSKYNDNLSSGDLFNYLEENNFTVRRKIGSFC
ncbi:MAG: hypothetical protein ACQEXX_01490 [Bacillota bacterium]